MNGKKTLPLLVIATLMLSLLPSIMFAHAAATITSPLANTTYQKGDTIKVIGSGVISGNPVQLYWDDASHTWNGVSGLTNSTTGASDGTFEVWMDVPDAIYGAHYLWVKDAAGNYDSIEVMVMPLLDLSSSSGLVGDTITAKMSGFAKAAALTLTWNGHSLTTATANSLGTAQTTFKVPDYPASLTPYTVTAYNVTDTTPAVNVTTTADLTIGPVITVNPISTTVGSLVTISGRGFYGSAAYTPVVTLTFTDSDDVLHTYPCYITTDTPITLDSTGRLRLTFVVPSVLETSDGYSVAIAVHGMSATADFEVTALSDVSVTPEHGAQASTITVSGVNFPKISGKQIDITIGGSAVGTVDTLSDGTFSKTFRVPAIGDGNYLDANGLRAQTDDPYMVNATTNFKVGAMNIILSDDSGPTGMNVGITGNGFQYPGSFNATIGSTTLDVTGDVSSAGLINDYFLIPQLPVGTYTITVWDVSAEIELTTQFKITSTTQVTLNVPAAPNGYNVTFTGSGFSSTAIGQLSTVIYNTTSTGAPDWWMNINLLNNADGVTNAQTDDNGNFTAYYVVDSSDVISQGKYFFNVTDASGDYTVTLPFTISALHISAMPRKPSFAIGETISFVLQHSFGLTESYLKIYDPSANLVFRGDPLTVWTSVGTYKVAPYSSQTAGGNPMTLADDAPTGTWSFKWYDPVADENVATGSFNVTAASASGTGAQITALAAQVTALTAQLTTLSTTVSNVATTATAASTAATASSQAATAASQAATAASLAATAAGSKADAATAAANAAATAAQGAQSAANGLTTLVYAAIGASLVAALAAIVALMQISRKIA
jgi:hypothetical protein